jgi:hypothetical protein
MSIIRSVWNGPFFIGKLAQPVSVGDVILKSLEVVYRLIIVVIGLLAAVAAILAVYSYVVEPMFFPPAKDSIEATAFYAADVAQPQPNLPTLPVQSSNRNNQSALAEPTLPTMNEIKSMPCDRKFPIRISMVNKGSSTINRVSFDLEGYASGFSTNYVENLNFAESAAILLPDRGWSSCYAVRTKNNVPPESLEYKVKIWSAAKADR